MSWYTFGNRSSRHVDMESQAPAREKLPSSPSSTSLASSTVSTNSAFSVSGFRNSGSAQIRGTWNSSPDKSSALQGLKKKAKDLLTNPFKNGISQHTLSAMALVSAHLYGPGVRIDQAERMRNQVLNGGGDLGDVVRGLSVFLEMQENHSPLSPAMQARAEQAHALLNEKIQINDSQRVPFKDFVNPDSYDKYEGILRHGWDASTQDRMHAHLSKIREFAKEYKDSRSTGARLMRNMNGSGLRMFQKTGGTNPARTNSAPVRMQRRGEEPISMVPENRSLSWSDPGATPFSPPYAENLFDQARQLNHALRENFDQSYSATHEILTASLGNLYSQGRISAVDAGKIQNVLNSAQQKIRAGSNQPVNTAVSENRRSSWTALDGSTFSSAEVHTLYEDASKLNRELDTHANHLQTDTYEALISNLRHFQLEEKVRPEEAQKIQYQLDWVKYKLTSREVQTPPVTQAVAQQISWPVRNESGLLIQNAGDLHRHAEALNRNLERGFDESHIGTYKNLASHLENFKSQNKISPEYEKRIEKLLVSASEKLGLSKGQILNGNDETPRFTPTQRNSSSWSVNANGQEFFIKNVADLNEQVAYLHSSFNPLNQADIEKYTELNEHLSRFRSGNAINEEYEKSIGGMLNSIAERQIANPSAPSASFFSVPETPLNRTRSFGVEEKPVFSPAASELQSRLNAWVQWADAAQQKIDMATYLRLEDEVENMPQHEQNILENTLAEILQRTN